MDWKKILLAAGGAAGTAAVLYYLLREDGAKSVSVAEEKEEGTELKNGKVNVEQITKEQVRQVLQEIIQSQEHMKTYMKSLTKELLAKELTFEQTYQRVKDMQPKDPLESYGLTMGDFDQLLDTHQSDPFVRESIARIMGAPSPNSTASAKVQSIAVKTILDVHQFMLGELEGLVTYFNNLPNKSSFDMKTVTIAAQAIVGSRVEGKFGITSDDIESAVLMYHTVLATDQEFANVNVKIQGAMTRLMGNSFQ